MMELRTICAVCETLGNSKPVFPSNVNIETFNAEVFSARRLPDRQHYQWVRCSSCGLLRSDPVLEVNLTQLYEESTFDYSTEVNGLKKTYLGLVKKAIGSNTPTRSIFEVGGGNGFFLEAAKDFGFKVIAGVEPSHAAISAAREDVRPFLIASMMSGSVLPKNTFQLGAMFHTLDHLQDPIQTLRDCLNALEPGGTFVAAVHNERSWSARLLGERSPIIDVEHTYLYSLNTGIQLFEKAGFKNVRSGAYNNHYSLAYILHLLPISRRFRKLVLGSWVGKFLGKIKIVVPLGNMWIVGVKP
jgi:SAM-dependent methyltransferase